MDRIALIGLIQKDRRSVTRDATVRIYDAVLGFLAKAQRDVVATKGVVPTGKAGVVSTRECPVCARRRKAKAKAMKRWRENRK